MEIDQSPSSFPHNEKIDKILQKLLVPNFEIKNGVSLNLLLTRLVGKNEDGKSLGFQCNEQLRTQFCQWIILASDLWENRHFNPPVPVLSFALNLASQLSEDEHIFFKLNCRNVFESLIKVGQATSHEYHSVTVGIITLLCSFLDHKSGVQWVMATPHWNHFLNLGLSVGTTTYIKQKVYHFIVKLMEKTTGLNQNFTVNIIKLLTMPFKEIISSLPNEPPLSKNEDIEFFNFLKPTLDLLSEVLTILLTNFNANVLQLFLEEDIPATVEELLLFSQNQDFTFELLKIQFVFLFYNMRLKLEEEELVTHNSTTLHDIKTMFDLISNEMNKNNVRGVVKICEYAHNLYDTLALDIPLCIRKGELIEFQTQMVIFQIVPVMVINLQLRGGVLARIPSDELRRHFMKKLTKLAAIKSFEICIKWRDQLLKKSDLMEDVTFCLQFLIRRKKQFSKDRAAKTVTVLVHIISDIAGTLTSINWTQRYIEFVKTVLNIVIDLVENFDLTWRDAVETLWLMDVSCELVQYPDWPDETIIIKSLKLLKTTVSKYMSPNMVLLVYSIDDSTVGKTGSLLYSKCHSSSWEIRNGALEVVYALAVNANSKFPALTNVLLNVELPHLVAKLALNDDQPRVRATACKCLQELTQIQEIWEVLIRMDSFLSSILNVFEKETDGNVRQEAATLVFKIYKFRNFPDDMLLRLYDVMTHATIGDLYWEVKCNALEFWFQTWTVFLTNQGMIDQSFPTHTFSTELKKIIALTDAEVNKRIIKVLNQLSQIGCLYVMKYAVQDKCDSEVSKKAVEFTMDMLKMFRRYKISADCENMNMNKSSGPSAQVNNCQEEGTLCDAVRSVSPSTLTAFGSDYFGDYLDSPSPDTYFDPGSPLPPPISPSLDIVLTPLYSENPQKQEAYTEVLPCATVPLQTPSSSIIQNSSLDNHSNGELGEGQCTTTEFEKLGSNLDSSQEEKILEKLINLMDTGLLEESRSRHTQSTYSHFDLVSPLPRPISSSLDIGITPPDSEKSQKQAASTQACSTVFLQATSSAVIQDSSLHTPVSEQNTSITNSNNKMKTLTYLAPSQYVKFVYDEVEKMSLEKERNSLDELDSLLNEILEEYNIVIDNNNINEKMFEIL